MFDYLNRAFGKPLYLSGFHAVRSDFESWRAFLKRLHVRQQFVLPPPHHYVVWCEYSNGSLLACGRYDPCDQGGDSRLAKPNVVCQEYSSTFLFSIAAVETRKDVLGR
jgi:hypothetical protein